MLTYTKDIRKQFRESIKSEIEKHGKEMYVEQRTMATIITLAGFILTIYYNGSVSIYNSFDKEEYHCSRTKLRRELREMSPREIFWMMVRAETERRTVTYLKEKSPRIQKIFYKVV